MSPSAISLRDLTKTFPPRHRHGLFAGRVPGRCVLSGVSLEVKSGEAVALLGVNGAGKTSLLEIISTVLLPTSGSASVFGFDVVKDPDVVRKMIGYCSADHHSFYPRLSAFHNLEFFASLNGLSGAEARVRASETLALIGLDELRDEMVQRYSDGMRQRLLLARALLSRPKVLLLDEPTKSLDPEARRDIGRLIAGMVKTEGTTVLLVTHSLEEAASLCGRMVELRDGVISASPSSMSVNEAVLRRMFAGSDQ
jgi:ABC-2 type transport system ATP-binding protein